MKSTTYKPKIFKQDRKGDSSTKYDDKIPTEKMFD